MRCPRCAHDNPAGQKFCGECGTPLAIVCSACGASNAPSQKFCGECGARLTLSAAALPPAAPATYTPKHLAEKILTSKAALEGERKQVTVLFADLKGSTELLADRDPEEARKLLDPVLEHMMEAVHRYEGTVNQVMGDGIMALFGAPLAHEDHAIRACYAALRMQQSVRRYAEGIFRSHGLPVEIRVGLNSGDVVVRAIASDLHMDYTAVGQTTHLAARMEQMARPGTVLVTTETLALAEGFVQVSSRGPVPVKGLSEPIEVFELCGANPVRSRLHAAATRGLTRFVGRDVELGLLRKAQDRVSQGHGQVMAIVGEPGVGKSRLVWEFTHSHRSEDWLVLEAASVSYGKASTYYPIIELLRRYFQIEVRDDTRKVREKVTGKLLSLDRAQESALPVILSLLDVPVDDTEWSKLDPPQRRRRILDALKRLLIRESHVQPMLLVFEDLHWIDTETQAFLDTLVESVPTTRLLLLVNYRPEYTHGWGSKTYYQQLRLDSLPIGNAAELLQSLLGAEPELAPLQKMLIDRTQGNPFFLEETVQALVETGALMGERGAYRVAASVHNLQVPATVQSILMARIDRLVPDDKRLLQTAAVVGKDVPFSLLQTIAELEDDALRAGLGRLQAAEFLYEAQLFPDLEYTFKHALTHEVAYGGVLQDRRRILHAAIARSLLKGTPDSTGDDAERVAHHAFLGEEWDQAVTLLRRAAQRSFERSAFTEAVERLEHALVALEHLPQTRAARELAVDVRLAMRHALFPLTEQTRMRRILDEARAAAETIGDESRLGRVLVHLTHCLWMAGDHREAMSVGQQAIGIAKRLGDEWMQREATWFSGQSHHGAGDYRRAAELLRLDTERLLSDSERSCRLWVFFSPWLTWSLAELGDLQQGSIRATEALPIAEAAGSPWRLSHAWYAVGLAHLFEGDFADAIAALERGLEIAARAPIAAIVSRLRAPLGIAYAMSGRAATGITVLQEAVEKAAAQSFLADQSRTFVWLGKAWLLADSVENAGRAADRALMLARQHGERGHEAWGNHLLAEIASKSGDVESAGAYYREARSLASGLGMRPLMTHCDLGLGILFRRVGNRAESQEHLITAVTMYREMGMTYWLEKAEAEMRELSA